MGIFFSQTKNFNFRWTLTSISCPCLYIVFIMTVLYIFKRIVRFTVCLCHRQSQPHWTTPFISCSCLGSRACGTAAFAGLLLLTLWEHRREAEGDFFVSNSSLLLNTLTQQGKQFVPSVKLKWISFLLLFKFQGTDTVSEFQVSSLAFLIGHGQLICKYGESFNKKPKDSGIFRAQSFLDSCLPGSTFVLQKERW